MDFHIEVDLKNKLQQISEFVEERLIPLEPLLLKGQWQELDDNIAKLQAEVKTKGWWAPHLPVSIGGSYTTLVNLGLIAEQLGQSPLGHLVFGCQAPDAGNAELLHLFGTESQQQQWLHPLAKGDIRSCFAMTEPHTAGSNPTLLQSSAVLEGDEWVINGRKWFTSSADGASFTIAMVVTDPDAQKHQRASMIIVPLENPGYKMIRNIPVMGHSGHGYFSHAEVEFNDCRVQATNLLGQRGQGFALAQERLGPGRIQHCMRWLGIGKRALTMMCQYVKQRPISQHQTLADQQLMQAMIADSAAEMAAARAMVLETAWRVENEGFKQARDQVALIKFFTANTLQKVVDRALQSHGALGMTDDTILSYFYREERAARIYDGPDEVHRLSVARKILKNTVI